MKIKSILSLLLIIAMLAIVVSLSSCASKPPELDEIRDDIQSLILASLEINKILFGEGLDIATEIVEGEKRPVATDYENYYYVAPETGYFMVQDIKNAAEKVFSKDYIEPLYENFFTGHYDADLGGVVRAIYMDSDYGLLKLKDYEPYIQGSLRSYDFSSIRMSKPSNADYVTFTIDSYKDHERLNITLAIVLTEDGWRLDSPTY